MPEVELDLQIAAPLDVVWATVLDIERYPALMTNVVSVRIEEWEEPTVRRTEWSMIVKGAVLVWRDREWIHHDDRRVTYTQVSGDLERFEGIWSVEPGTDGTTRVRLTISFEVGIPLLAAMINPVAQRAMYDNCVEMLEGIEQRAMSA